MVFGQKLGGGGSLNLLFQLPQQWPEKAVERRVVGQQEGVKEAKEVLVERQETLQRTGARTCSQGRERKGTKKKDRLRSIK